MAFIPVENTALVELRYLYFGQQVENGLYFHREDGIALADLQSLAAQVGAWWQTLLAPFQSSSLTLNEVYVTDLTTQTSPVWSDTSLNSTPGGYATSAGLPGNVSLTVSFRTTGRGRSARGRNYFVGIGEDLVTGNTVGGSLITGIELAYNSIGLEISPDWRWVVVSKYTNGAARAEGFIQTITNAIVVDPYIDSQRRRLTGRGQ